MKTMLQQEKEKPGILARYMPILHWLPHYNKAWLSGDIVAGLSVCALMVPQCLGFAAICGVPVQYGLYAAAISLIVYALFASSRHVVTGPSSTIAAVTGAAVLTVAKAGSSEAIALVAAITISAGLFYIILSVLRMGWVSNFLAESVLVGFVFGIGIDVAVGQLKHVTGTMDVKAMKRLYRLKRTEFWVGTIALLGVLTFGTLQGVITGLLLSLLVLIARSSRPDIPVLGRSPGTEVFHRLNENPDSETLAGLVILRFDGPLYFANANALRDRVRAVTTAVIPPVTMVLIDMEGVNYIDLEGCDMLNEITENMKGIGIEIHLARVKRDVMEMLKKDGVDKIMGRDHIHIKVAEAVRWFAHKDKPVITG